MISYRSIKRLLGETSLERKCRFLFGAGLLLLISGSFYFYAAMTDDLIADQRLQMAEALAPQVFKMEHLVFELVDRRPKGAADRSEGDGALQSVFPELDAALESIKHRKKNISPDLKESEDIKGWSLGQATQDMDRDAINAFTDPTVLSYHDTEIDDDGYRILSYYEPMRAKQSCIGCHNRVRKDAAAGGPYPKVELGEDLGLLRVDLNLDATDDMLKRNDLLLLALAILTAFLAMLGAYAIVRYVIVKPVLHLKDVSEEISRGNLEFRADINTGDEFEQLSHAFNRMLRHMTTVNDELRNVNTDLDSKVDQLAQVNLRLYETNKMKDEFLATMSHELRTPLNSIIGFSEVLLAGDRLDEKQRRYVGTIESSGQNLLALINDLLDLAKIESGKLDIQAVEFDLEELIGRQTDNIQPLAEKKNIELKWDVPPGTPKLLQDFGKMSQILNNLLSNAIKFTPEGGRVRVSGRQVNRRMIDIFVEDSGIGIPLDEQDKIFEKFRQGTTTPGERDHMTREYEGTGLGLSIVRELSHLLGGDVSLQSEFGKGSTFKVRLPLEVPLDLDPTVDIDADTEVDPNMASTR